MRGVLGIVGVVDNDGDDDVVVVVVVVVMERRKHCCCCLLRRNIGRGRAEFLVMVMMIWGQQVGKNTRIKLR